MRLILLCLAAGCAGAGVDAAAPAPDVRCFAARAAAEAEVRGATVTPHPTVAGRWTVAGPGVAGKIEAATPDCAGFKLSLWAVATGGRGGAGPRHLRISR